MFGRAKLHTGGGADDPAAAGARARARRRGVTHRRTVVSENALAAVQHVVRMQRPSPSGQSRAMAGSGRVRALRRGDRAAGAAAREARSSSRPRGRDARGRGHPGARAPSRRPPAPGSTAPPQAAARAPRAMHLAKARGDRGRCVHGGHIKARGVPRQFLPGIARNGGLFRGVPCCAAQDGFALTAPTCPCDERARALWPGRPDQARRSPRERAK